ncbi:MAG TPA: hypothetical protein DIW24_07105 [Bacteroidetes bacterium]|nr:hypothetical protein [Bacteroidota bacterium]HRR07136.1 hypothetical protein [Rhodothermales bacterium]
MKDIQKIALPGEQALLIEEKPEEALLQFVGKNGIISLTIVVTENGPILQVAGGDLCIRTAHNLRLEAEELTLYGRRKVSLTSDGEMDVAVSRDLKTSARQQFHRAELGCLSLYANDDVEVDGERILMNC